MRHFYQDNNQQMPDSHLSQLLDAKSSQQNVVRDHKRRSGSCNYKNRAGMQIAMDGSFEANFDQKFCLYIKIKLVWFDGFGHPC